MESHGFPHIASMQVLQRARDWRSPCEGRSFCCVAMPVTGRRLHRKALLRLSQNTGKGVKISNSSQAIEHDLLHTTASDPSIREKAWFERHRVSMAPHKMLKVYTHLLFHALSLGGQSIATLLRSTVLRKPHPPGILICSSGLQLAQRDSKCSPQIPLAADNLDESSRLSTDSMSEWQTEARQQRNWGLKALQLVPFPRP